MIWGTVMYKHNKILWNQENVSFFWSSYVEKSKNHGIWMSEGSGRAILRRIIQVLPKGFLTSPRIICDWGCGTGNFAKNLALKGHKVFGFDQKEVILQISNNINEFVPISESYFISNESIDLVYALEVIEHIIDSEIENTFIEWKRILKKNGYLLLTTPNDENLESNSIVCPNCRTEFHSVQHVRSLTPSSIGIMLQENGFEIEKIWLGEFFFSTSQGMLIEFLRKLWFIFRKIRENKSKYLKMPHMMVLCKLKVE